MAIMTFSGLSKEFGGEHIFNNLSGKVEGDSSKGLVGPNGIGKTPLLRLLSGRLEDSGGEVSCRKDLKTGYLQQEALGTDGENEELLEEYGRCLEGFEKSGGYDWELKIKKTLDGLGFSKDQWDMPLTHCSGGEKTRVLLGRLLLEEPDLLILDEPTNHLDMKAVEWLEGVLIRWEKALVVVSHDRYFLDSVSSTKWSVNETEAHIRALRVKNPYAKPMRMRIRCTDHLPDKVLAAENLTIGYGDNILFSLDKADLYKGERAALLGPNGCG